MRPPRDVRRPHPRQGPAHAGRWVPRSAPRRRGLPEDDERGGLGPLLPGRGRNVGGGDQMPLPAGRRQELAGLLLARAVLGDPGSVLERSFDQFRIVEDAEHRRSIAEISLCVPLPLGEGDRVRVHEPKRLRPLTQEAVDERGLACPVRSGEEDESGHGVVRQRV